MEPVKGQTAANEGAAKEAKKAAKKTKREARNKALELIKELCDKQTDKKYSEALAKVRPSLYGIVTRGEGGPKKSVLDIIVEKKKVSEDEMFKLYKVGRRDMAGIIRKQLKKAVPAERVWIDLNKDGFYTLEGKGANPPANWTGYVPSEEALEVPKLK